MLAHVLTNCLSQLLDAAVPRQAPIGFVRIKSRSELPDGLKRLAGAKPLPKQP